MGSPCVSRSVARPAVNRGSLKDDNGDHRGAIADYDKVIALGAGDPEQARLAFFNRGNAKLNLSDKLGACADWKKALSSGYPRLRRESTNTAVAEALARVHRGVVKASP